VLGPAFLFTLALVIRSVPLLVFTELVVVADLIETGLPHVFLSFFLLYVFVDWLRKITISRED
jgi:hypothetical protein